MTTANRGFVRSPQSRTELPQEVPMTEADAEWFRLYPGHPVPYDTLELIDERKAWEYIETAIRVKSKTPNRPLSQRSLKRLTKEIMAGDWSLTSQGIGFDWNGVLRDGQHRLYAVIQSKGRILTFVKRGMPPETFENVDKGKTRTPQDLASLRGELNTSKLITAIGWQHAQNIGRLAEHRSNKSELSMAERWRILDRHPGIRDAIKAVGPLLRRRKFIKPGTAVWLYYRMSGVDPLEAYRFFDSLLTGANMGEDDPVYRCRERLIDGMGIRGREGISHAEQAALVVKAWNLRRTGETRKVLVWRRGEAFPLIDGDRLDA